MATKTPELEGHRPHIYMDDQNGGTYSWSCSCGSRPESGGYLIAEYARDGWREAHGLDPIINYPLV